MRVLSVLISALVTVSLSGAAAQPPANPDEAPIRALFETTLPARYNAADAHGIASLWGDDATHTGLVRGATLRTGRTEIERMWTGGLSQPNRDRERRMTQTVTAMRFIRPDIATVDVLITYRGGRNADGAPKPDTGELLFAVVSRESGAWMIAASRVVPLPLEPAR